MLALCDTIYDVDDFQAVQIAVYFENIKTHKAGAKAGYLRERVGDHQQRKM